MGEGIWCRGTDGGGALLLAITALSIAIDMSFLAPLPALYHNLSTLEGVGGDRGV